MRENAYKVGDVVYLNPQIVDVDWTYHKFVSEPFIITAAPADNEHFKTYTLQLSNGQDWTEHRVHHFFITGDPNA